MRRDAHQHIVNAGSRVFHEHVEIPVLVEDPRVQQFVFRRADPAALILGNQVRVGECRLRILVEHLQIRMRRRRVQVVVELLDVFAVISLAVGQPEKSLLQNRIALIPQRQGQAQNLVVVGKSRDTVFAPAIRAAAGVIVRKIVPGIAMRAVVLAHRAPLPFAQIRTPLLPRGRRRGALRQPLLFNVHRIIL